MNLTAISHIGPAMAYLAQIKANGDARWKARLELLGRTSPPCERSISAVMTIGSTGSISRLGLRAKRRSAT